nr:NADH dehydrogenase subunit 3 [Cylindrotaenia sp. MN-2022]
MLLCVQCGGSMVWLYGVLVFFLLFLIIGFFCSGIFNKDFCCSLSWASPYECGFCSNSVSLDCFSFTYFSLLVYFVIFDLEISLLLNMPEQGLLFMNFLYYYLFLVILSVSFLVELFLGYVRWGY